MKGKYIEIKYYRKEIRKMPESLKMTKKEFIDFVLKGIKKDLEETFASKTLVAK